MIAVCCVLVTVNLLISFDLTITVLLTKILTEESVEFELAAINAIARLAYGSMCDALSIVDQVVSYTKGNFQESTVMLTRVQQGVR